MIKILFYLLKFFKTSFLWLWVNEVVGLKILKPLLNLFHIDAPINKILFWPKLRFLRDISKAMCDLVLYLFHEETKVH